MTLSLRPFFRAMIEKILQPVSDRVFASPSIFRLKERFNRFSAVKDEFLNELSLPKGRLLEIGCSVGTCASVVVPMDRLSYVGIDIDPAYIELARKQCPAGEFYAMDARRLSFENQSFDRVLFFSVLHHFDQSLALSSLAEVRRVLKPEGLVLVAEPIVSNALNRFLLSIDRGRFVRSVDGYRELFIEFSERRSSVFEYWPYRLASFVLQPKEVQ